MEERGKIERVILAESDQKVREGLGCILARLANVVDRFSDGDAALDYAKKHPAQLLVISMNCWNNADESIAALKAAKHIDPKCLVICTNKMMPKHFNQLRRLGITQLFGAPIEPVYLFRIVHNLYGIIARQYIRVTYKCPVFWGEGDQREVIGETLDISCGGMRVLTDKVLSCGSSLYWGIQLDEHTFVQARGEILKVDDTVVTGQHAYGVIFIDIPSMTRMILDEAVNTFVFDGAPQAEISFLEERK